MFRMDKKSSSRVNNRCLKFTSSVLFVASVKLLCVVLLTLLIEPWWEYVRDPNGIVDSCTNTQRSACHSHCHEIRMVNTSVAINLPSLLLELNVNNPYYIAEFDGRCALGYWGLFKLVPLGLIIVQFVLQCVCYFLFDEFVPQQQQYDAILKCSYPELLTTETLES
jgi:hypothetical protein